MEDNEKVISEQSNANLENEANKAEVQKVESDNEQAIKKDTNKVNELESKELTEEEIDNLTEEEIDYLLGDTDQEEFKNEEEKNSDENETVKGSKEFNKNAEEKRKRLKYENEIMPSGYTRKEENILLKQIEETKQAYDGFNVDELDNDSEWVDLYKEHMFKKSIKEIYEIYKDTKKEQEEEKKRYRASARYNSSSGTSKSNVDNLNNSDIYSEKDLNELIERLPRMNQREQNKILEKVERSIAYYERKERNK